MSEHENLGDKPRDLGLRAIRDARLERATPQRRLTPRAILSASALLFVFVGSAWLWSGFSLSRSKTELLSKQRATVATVGAAWNPLRDRLEQWTLHAAGAYPGDFIDASARTWDFRSAPGMFLRLRVSEAASVESMRKAADHSLRDSLVGCLMRENNPSAAARARGQTEGLSGWNDQPWNLRLAYFATRVLGDTWANEASSATDEIHLRVYVQGFEKAQREEIPLAIDMVKKSQFFLLVLDEEPAGAPTGDALLEVPHPTRVHLFDLRGEGREIARLRLSVSADYRTVTPATEFDPKLTSAVRRQVQNCALGQDIWAKLHSAP